MLMSAAEDQDSVTLIFNREVVEKIPLSADARTRSSKTLEPTRSGWYHLRARRATSFTAILTSPGSA